MPTVEKPATKNYPRLTLVISCVSAILSAYAIKYTVESQAYPSARDIAGTDWHCVGACALDE